MAPDAVYFCPIPFVVFRWRRQAAAEPVPTTRPPRELAGICGDWAPSPFRAGTPPPGGVCDLPSGHLGWHGCDNTDGSRMSWTERKRMSTSTDGLLVYGYDIGGEDEGFAFEEFTEGSSPAWFDPDDEDGEGAITRFKVALRRASGFTESYEDGQEGYFTREREADDALGVEFVEHCSDGCPMYFLAAFHLRAARGYPEALDLAELGRRAADEGWDARLAGACRLLGLTPEGRPGWHLASYWG